MNIRTRKFAAARSLLAITAALFAVTIGFAQASAPATASTTKTETVTLDKFEVTGSLLSVSAAQGALAVTTMDRTMIDRAATPVLSDFFRTKLPQVGGSGVLNEGFGNGGNGQAYISLRGLPGGSTLSLVDGRRTEEGGDLNLIPTAAIERVEVLYDGAAAVYGSEAISGVINVILRKKYRGAKLTTYYGNTTEKDADNKSVELLVGTGTDTTNIVIAGNWSKGSDMFSTDRTRSTPGGDAVSGTSNPGLIVPVLPAGTPAGTIAARWYLNAPTANSLTAASQLPAGFLPTVMILPNNAPTTYTAPAGWTAFRSNAGESTTNARTRVETQLNTTIGSSARVQYGANAVLGPGLFPGFPFGYWTFGYRPHTRYGAYGYADHKVNDWLTVVGQVSYMFNRSVNQLAPSPLSNRPLLGTNYWVQQVLPGSPTTQNYTYTYRPTELGPRQTINKFDDLNAYVGVQGQIPRTTWKYRGGYQYNPSNYFSVQTGGVITSRYDAALAANTAAAALNPFGWTPVLGGPSPVNPQTLIASFQGQSTTRYEGTLAAWDANVQGELFRLPAGPIAISGTIARRTFTFTNQPDFTIAQSPVLIFPFNFAEPSSGNRVVKSYAAEVNIPILGESLRFPFAESLALGLAYRNEDYKDRSVAVLGTVNAKRSTGVPRYTLLWVPIKDELTLRASYAEGFVAPGLGAIALARGQNFTELLNPVTGIRAQPTSAVITTGNPGLQPTTAKSWAVGGAYSPKWLKGFSANVNYYAIEQANIPFASAQYVVNQWYGARGTNTNPNDNASNPYRPGAGPSAANPLGANVILNADFSLNSITNIGSINSGKRKTDGLDVTLTQKWRTNNWGAFEVSTNGTYMFTLRQANFPGDRSVSYLGKFWPGGFPNDNTGFPRLRGNASVDWNWRSYGTSLSLNHSGGFLEDIDRGSTANNPNPGSLDFSPRPVVSNAQGFPLTGVRTVRASNTVDLQLRWTIPWTKTRLAIGSNNIFDEAPPFVPTSFESNIDRRLADLRGRFYYVRLTQEF